MKANVIVAAGIFLFSLWAIRSPAQVISLSQIKSADGPNCFISPEAITRKNSKTSRLLAESPVVRAAYIIPANRTAQPHAPEKIQALLNQAQAYYREQMEMNGFGDKTFRYEKDPGTGKPVVHLINSRRDDAYFRGDAGSGNNYNVYARNIEAAQEAGFSIFAANEVWLLISESHLMNPDGTYIGDVGLGASFGSANDGGVAVLGSNYLPFLDKLTDAGPYDGQVVPEFGPYPIKKNVTFGSSIGTTFSNLASNYVGAAIHELGHAFGLPHDTRNHAFGQGNLMGAGYVYARGALFPSVFTSEYMRLEYAAALYLNTSHYFNPNKIRNQAPSLSVRSDGAISNGLLNISFDATDADGLASAFLLFNGERVGELPLDGTSVSTRFATPFVASGTKEYTVSVLDNQGNRTDATLSVTALRSGNNEAPKPKIGVFKPVSLADAQVLLKSAAASDGNDAITALQVRWDLNNDSTFDTEWIRADRDYVTTFPKTGNYRVRAQFKDPDQAVVTSAPLAVNIREHYTDDFPCTGAISYSKGCSGFSIGLNGVTVGETILSASSGCSANGYQLFNASVKNLVPGNNYPFSLSLLSGTNPVQAAIWIDFDGNGSFSSSEKVFYTIQGSTGPITGSFSIPADAVHRSNARMRVVTNYGSPPDLPCGSYEYGETEDYAITITNCDPNLSVGDITSFPPTSCLASDGKIRINVPFTDGTPLTLYFEQEGVEQTKVLTVTDGHLEMTGLTAGSYPLVGLAYKSCPLFINKTVSLTAPVPDIGIVVSGATSFCPGDGVTISVNTSEGSFQSFQWKKDGAPVPGATGREYRATEPGAYTLAARTGTCTASSPEVTLIYKKTKPEIHIVDGNTLSSSESSAGYQWYINGILIQGATSRSYQPSKPGQYHVKGSPEGCVSEMSNEFEWIILSTEPSSLLNGYELTVFPNPAKTEFFIELKVDKASEAIFQLIDLNGRKVLPEARLNAAVDHRIFFDTSPLNPGIYLIEIRFDKHHIFKKITLM
ncbi:hypothetical protein GCM10023091_36920 [Ravibacter arvi]|uniref:Secreted protein (Por secretion system target) n=1 Tax=Ravibacter arvi TaxID=2051041 RepID=A0ABP8M9Z2_9BACT